MTSRAVFHSIWGWLFRSWQRSTSVKIIPQVLRPPVQYGLYLARHKWFVFVAACKLGVPWLGIAHDLSKLRWAEFWPYADYFYGGPHRARVEYSHYERREWPHIVDRECKEAVQERFDEAWLKHQHANKHHWQHWVLREDSGVTKVLPMPGRYRREMLADWRGAGMAITGKDNTAAWFQKNRPNMILHPDTLAWLYAELGLVIPWQDNIRVPRPDGVQFTCTPF